MYFMNDYLNDLYFEKVASEKRKDVQKKKILGVPYTSHKVKGFRGREEEHVIYNKKTKDRLADARPKAYAGLLGMGGGYLGQRMGTKIVEHGSKDAGRFGKFVRNPIGRITTIAAPTITLGYEGMRSGHHIGKALNEYSNKYDINM